LATIGLQDLPDEDQSRGLLNKESGPGQYEWDKKGRKEENGKFTKGQEPEVS